MRERAAYQGSPVSVKLDHVMTMNGLTYISPAEASHSMWLLVPPGNTVNMAGMRTLGYTFFFGVSGCEG